MKKSKTIGVVILILAAGCWYYLKNYTRVLSDKTIYEAHFTDIGGLQEGAPVFLKGVKIGRVDDIRMNEQRELIVYVAVKDHIDLKEGARATINSGDVNGSRSLELVQGDGRRTLPPHSVLPGTPDSSLLLSFHAKISPLLHHGNVLLRSADSGLQDFNVLIIGGLGHQTQESIESFAHTMQRSSHTSAEYSATLRSSASTFEQAKQKTAHLAASSGKLSAKLRNIEQKSEKAIEKTALKKDLQDLGTSLAKLSDNLQRLKSQKMLADSSEYKNAVRSVDSFNRSVKEYSNHPPPLIKILDF